MKQTYDEETLFNLGEERILRELVLPRCSDSANFVLGVGDDCAAFLPWAQGEAVVITTDPCPTPVANLINLGGYYNYGWLTVVINISDLGAMGARPIGLLSSTVMHQNMLVREYVRFLDGLCAAAEAFECPIVGGNIKDGPEFTASATAFGSIRPDRLLTRAGAKPGHVVFVVGEMGMFWASVLSFMQKLHLEDADINHALKVLTKPMPKIDVGIGLAEQRVASSCMDSSDGITSCLYTIAEESQVDILVNLNSLRPHLFVYNVARQIGIDYRKLMLSWGGWELVGTVPCDQIKQARRITENAGYTFTIVGQVNGGGGNVYARDDCGQGSLTDLGSHRFTGSSYFTNGLESYISLLISAPIYTSNVIAKRT